MAASNLRNNIDITDTTVGVTVSEDVYRDVFLSFICFVLSLFPCDSYHQTLESSFFFPMVIMSNHGKSSTTSD